MPQYLQNWSELNTDERLQTLLRIDSSLPSEEIEQLLSTAQDTQNDDILRIEIWKVLGLYSDEQYKSTIRKAIHAHWQHEQDEEYVQIAMLEALSALGADQQDIQLASSISQQDEYILVRSAAFALLRHHRHIPHAKQALEQLQNDPDFGQSATQALQEQ
ncbi:hypothetical protein ACE3MZ_08745 [Paenibacillus sp. WLX1005]|uniref:hypothetical protein n=1 Tax=Paenibacillus sp. WLX1005 TaxID=3243766 RepID=UPI0039841A02